MPLTIKHFAPTTTNLGDTLLNRGAQKVLEQIGDKEVRMMSLTSHPHYHLQNASSDDLQGQGLCKEAMALGPQADLIAIGGGPIWGSPGLLRVSSDFVANYQHLPIVLVGVGCFQYHKSDYSAVSEIFDQIIAFSSRDQQTAIEAKKHLNCPVFMTGCPALYLKDLPIKRKPSNYFIITYRSQHLPADLECSVSFITKLSSLIQAKPLVVFHDYRDYFYASAQLAQHNIPFLFANDIDATIQVYQSAQFVFTYRLHGEIISATSGTPFFHLAIDERGKYFGHTFDPSGDFHHYLCDQSITQSQLLAKIQNSLTRSYQAYNHKRKQARQNLVDFINCLASLV